MATLRDSALAAYNAKAAEWVTKGQERLRPVFTDATGKLALDPLTKTVEAHHDSTRGLLVLHTDDGSDLYFAVYPDDTTKPVTMVELVDGQWTGHGGTGNPGPVVASLADVGAVLAGEA